MKFITILVLFLSLTQISINLCGTVSKRNHRFRNTRRFSTRSFTKQAKNKWYQFFVGLIMGITDQDNNDLKPLNACIPENWKIADATDVPLELAAEDTLERQEKEDQEKQAQEKKPEKKPFFTRLLDGLEKLIAFVCRFKDSITKLFVTRMRRYVRRNRYRLFSETRVTRYQKGIKETFKKAGEKIKAGFQKIGEKIKIKLKEIGEIASKIKDWANKKWEDFKEWGRKIVEKIKAFWKNAIAKVKLFFSGNVLENIKSVFNCAQNAKGVVSGLISVIKGFIKRISDIAQIAAGNYLKLATLIVDLICNFKIFRKAFSNLVDAIKSKDVIIKFQLAGKFLGYLFRALVTKK